jgi:hypothetical protein
MEQTAAVPLLWDETGRSITFWRTGSVCCWPFSWLPEGRSWAWFVFIARHHVSHTTLLLYTPGTQHIHSALDSGAQDWQCTCKCNFQARSRDQCSPGRVISITYCVWWSLSYPLWKAHASYFTVVCGLSGCTVIFNIISQMTGFLEKKWSNIKCLFGFSVQIWSETFLSRRIQRDITINVRGPSGKHRGFLSDF